MSANELRKLSKDEIAKYMQNLKTAYLTGAIEKDMFDAARQMVRAEIIRRL